MQYCRVAWEVGIAHNNVLQAKLFALVQCITHTNISYTHLTYNSFNDVIYLLEYLLVWWIMLTGIPMTCSTAITSHGTSNHVMHRL